MASTVRHCDGAEAQNLDWVINTQGNPTAGPAAATARTGVGRYLLDAAVTPEQIELPMETDGLLTNRNTITDDFILIGSGVRFTDITPGTTYAFVEVLDEGPVVIASLELEDDGDLVFRDFAGTALLTVTNPFTVNVYSYIEILVDRGAAGATNSWELWIDGITQGSDSNGDFTDQIGNEPDLVRFSAGSLGDGDVLIDDYYVKSATIFGDATPLANSSGELEVFAFQAGSGATATGTLDTGSVTDIDDLPRDDGTLIEHDPNPAAWEVDTDAASAEGLAGPSGAAEIDGDSNIKVAVWDHRLERTNGSSPTSLDQSWGNSGTVITQTDRAASLTASLQNFFTTSPDQAAELPLSTEFFAYGIRKVDAGGRDIHCANIFAQLLHVPAAVAITPGEIMAAQQMGRRDPYREPAEVVAY